MSYNNAQGAIACLHFRLYNTIRAAISYNNHLSSLSTVQYNKSSNHLSSLSACARVSLLCVSLLRVPRSAALVSTSCQSDTFLRRHMKPLFAGKGHPCSLLVGVVLCWLWGEACLRCSAAHCADYQLPAQVMDVCCSSMTDVSTNSNGTSCASSLSKANHPSEQYQVHRSMQ